jgi:endonuclease/exonuclease/phosphatase family metal-dependent hydrolase
MRLATFNLLHGRSPLDGVVDAGRLRDAVADLDADVLAIQEVDHDQPRSSYVDQTALAARALGAAHARYLPALVGTPGETWREATPDDAPGVGPTYGIGLVSRLPVDRWVRIPLGTSPVSLPLLIDARRPAMVRDEPRVGLAAVLAPGAPVGTVVATHLSFAPGFNVAQLARLVRAVRELPDPVVLLGDLNMPGPVPTAVLRGWHALARMPTFPSEQPRIQFDHVLARAATPPPVVDARTVATPVSDHRALVVDLDGVSPGPPRDR